MSVNAFKQILLIFIVCLLPPGGLLAQSLQLESHSLAGTKNQLPFWLWANQLGHYDRNSDVLQNLRITAFNQYIPGDSIFRFEAGIDLDLLIADNTDLRFTQLFGGFNWKFLQLQIGAFADKEVYAGLSSTNGNLAASRNARPHPRVRAGFNRFVPVLVKWFSINGFYEEGLLNDKRYSEDAHLHRKALYLRFGQAKSIEVTGGMEHFVMWGGSHPEYGKLQGWDSYFDYVLGSTGDENSLMTDQLNVIGNGYGVYQLQIKKAWEKLHAVLYVSHPFDDRSGMELDNIVDNLWGLHLAFRNKQTAIEDLVLECFNTKNQSGKYHLVPDENGSAHGRGRDTYFNHGVYKSGATYHQMAMVSPLFAPVIVEDGISMGFENTRYTGFHIGARGALSSTLQWKGLLTWSNNFGHHDGNGGSTYSPSRKQSSALGELNWIPNAKKISIAVALAADYGSLYDNGISTARLGAMLSFNYYLYEKD
ncbi:capsule assembly Wzi family protein [Maribellus sediminis]|uniref:capsule assembly Wzi family protein n=1 Tax=Maribellus sediminis TaxID=2696285 RepID=UPI001430FE5F|nr:capsule assembly Wzi family protein [Maribellus sediminis]